MSRLNWKRCSKQARSRNMESIKGEGVELWNGAITPTIPKDSLARRAEAEMVRWRTTLKKRQQRIDGP